MAAGRPAHACARAHQLVCHFALNAWLFQNKHLVQLQVCGCSLVTFSQRDYLFASAFRASCFLLSATACCHWPLLSLMSHQQPAVSYSFKHQLPLRNHRTLNTVETRPVWRMLHMVNAHFPHLCVCFWILQILQCLSGMRWIFTYDLNYSGPSNILYSNI